MAHPYDPLALYYRLPRCCVTDTVITHTVCLGVAFKAVKQLVAVNVECTELAADSQFLLVGQHWIDYKGLL